MGFLLYRLDKFDGKLPRGFNKLLHWVFSPKVFPIFVSTLAVGLLLLNRLVVNHAGLGFLASDDKSEIPSGILFNPIDNLFYTSFPQQLFIGNTHLFLNPHTFLCLLYTSPSPRDRTRSRMPSSA